MAGLAAVPWHRWIPRAELPNPLGMGPVVALHWPETWGHPLWKCPEMGSVAHTEWGERCCTVTRGHRMDWDRLGGDRTRPTKKVAALVRHLDVGGPSGNLGHIHVPKMTWRWAGSQGGMRPEGLSWGQQGQSWDTHRVSEERWVGGGGQWGTPVASTPPDPMQWDMQVMRGHLHSHTTARTPTGDVDRPGCILESPEQPRGPPDHSSTPEVMGGCRERGQRAIEQGSQEPKHSPMEGPGQCSFTGEGLRVLEEPVHKEAPILPTAAPAADTGLCSRAQDPITANALQEQRCDVRAGTGTGAGGGSHPHAHPPGSAHRRTDPWSRACSGCRPTRGQRCSRSCAPQPSS